MYPLFHDQKFKPGKIVATPGALKELTMSGEFPDTFLRRHLSGDWGNLDDHDKRVNEEALKKGLRILSAYETNRGAKIWIITEWDRSVTTILLPEDY